MLKPWYMFFLCVVFLTACSGDEQNADGGHDGGADADTPDAQEDGDVDDAQGDGDADDEGGAPDGDAADSMPDGDAVDSAPDSDTPWGPAAAVDEFWGEAPPREDRLTLFDHIWDTLAARYAAFVTSDVDWDEIRTRYRPLVEEAPSYGRFFQLLSALFAELQDLHTKVSSQRVCLGDGDVDYLSSRPPVYFLVAIDSSIGACATATDDGRIFVTRADETNPADLAPGDELLGYDGVPWVDLLARIDAAELPWCGRHGTTEEAQRLRRLSSLVNNPHLFETLDLRRHGSSQDDSVATENLLGYQSNIICSDQLPVSGVRQPWMSWQDYANSLSPVSYGTVTGTSVGYIYVYAMTEQTQTDFSEAVSELWDSEGLIIDFRFNLGGSSTTAIPALAQLFGEDLAGVYNMWSRDRTVQEYDAMLPVSEGYYDVDADELTYFNKPIALLTGPNAASAGDGTAYLISRHPEVRRFGRTTNGGFGTVTDLWTVDPVLRDLRASYTPGILADEHGTFLHAAPQATDDAVWLDPDDVALGTDTVVEAALIWIDNQSAGWSPH